MNYTILKAIHLIAVLAWSAGLFYIGRIFVYYAEATSSEVKSTLGTMAIRLSRYIMLPSAIVTLLVGLHMAGVIGALSQGWFHLKLTLLILLFGYQHVASKFSKQLVAGTFQKSSRWCRVFNEVPIVLLTGIIFSVVTKDTTLTLAASGIITALLATFFIIKKPS
ncbi:MAG: CopD family protein [Candidatus Marinamargulisbacteria bacterium]